MAVGAAGASFLGGMLAVVGRVGMEAVAVMGQKNGNTQAINEEGFVRKRTGRRE